MKNFLAAFLWAGLTLLAPYTVEGKQPAHKYIFFLHNKFLELFDLQERHPEYGRAEYYEILKKFSEAGFMVISEKRPKDTDIKNTLLKSSFKSTA